MSKIKRIGILTGGGDCPGLNAAIRGIGKAALFHNGIEVIGILDGYQGLIENRVVHLDAKTLSGILTLGGTILGTNNKCSPEKYYEEVNKRIRKEFPQKFDSAPSKAAQVVAGQSRTPATGQKVKLSQVEAATAKKLGIPLDRYAAEKAKMASGDDYTVIG